MKSISILLLILIAFSGCTSSMDKAKQEVSCKEHGGVYSYGVGKVIACACNDGTEIQYVTWSAKSGKEVIQQLKD